MFVQTIKCKRGNKTYITQLIRQSFRTPKGPRSRTLCNISSLPEDLRQLICAALAGKPCFVAEELVLSCALDYGGLAVLVDAWARFGLVPLFADLPTRGRGLLQAMIFARLLFPGAKLALKEQAQGTLLAQACQLPAAELFDEDELYAAMDQLDGRWVHLEQVLYRQAFPQGVRLVLYDLTSVYFEGQGPVGLSRYGYSRDHRADRPQIMLAVATDTEGLPLHLEVLRGNRADNKTLVGLLHVLGRRFGIKEAVFVFDGGMSSQFNLAALTAAQLQFVTRLSSTTLKTMVAQLPKDEQLQLADRGKLIEVQSQGQRYVIAGGPWRQQRDLERRQARMAKGQAKLTQLAAVARKKVDAQKLASQAGRALQQLKAHKYFTYRVDEQGRLLWEPKPELIAEEQALDGWYLLHTNLAPAECDAQQTLAHYKGLLEVEDAFCQLKSYLRVRPVFHWRPDRVRNHVRICFLAYWLSARLGREWRAKGEVGEVPRLLRRFQKIRLGRLAAQGLNLPILSTQIPKDLNDLLAKLELLKLFAGPPSWAKL